ncbi:unnamed protein product [Fraxinus pennsylvanica]|uniref:B box-type domain-containing protein n=1 Tax=Fraxinus pennsylvanica TaxID=56036 RepID=A0AAD2EFU6_9LAMI|nr:unnamed protein product [Fraxinus pennsylvanica]
MRTVCDVCESAAAILFCAADEAALCSSCDEKRRDVNIFITELASDQHTNYKITKVLNMTYAGMTTALVENFLSNPQLLTFICSLSMTGRFKKTRGWLFTGFLSLSFQRRDMLSISSWILHPQLDQSVFDMVGFIYHNMLFPSSWIYYGMIALTFDDINDLVILFAINLVGEMAEWIEAIACTGPITRVGNRISEIYIAPCNVSAVVAEIELLDLYIY